VPGLWLGTGDEGAGYWLGLLTELRNRGVKDVLIAGCDGLTGFGDAIEAAWPQATVQTRVVWRRTWERTPSEPGRRAGRARRR
jgi:putative transposase